MTHIGFFERYFIIPFFRQYSDFGGVTSGKDALVSVGAWLIVTAGVVGVLLGFVGLLGPEVGFMALSIVSVIWLLGSACPMAALICRVLKKGTSECHEIRFLGIDKLLSAICLLFLVFGMLMTTTTLNSGEINMNPRNGNSEDEENPILMQDSIVEEPIFTYQDEAPKEPVKDTMTDLEEKDTISLSESFDPVVQTSAQTEIDTLLLETPE